MTDTIQQTRAAHPPKPSRYEREDMTHAAELAIRCELPHTADVVSVSELNCGSVRASVTVQIDAATFAAYMASDARRQWDSETKVGLRAALAKERKRVRDLEAKLKDATATKTEQQTTEAA